MLIKSVAFFMALSSCALSQQSSVSQKFFNLERISENFKQASLSAPSVFTSAESLFKALWSSKKMPKHRILMSNSQKSDSVSSFYSKKRFIQTSHDSLPVQLDESEIHALRRMGIKFMDVTDTHHMTELFSSVKPYEPFPTKITQYKNVTELNSQLSTEFTRNTLQKFTEFETRYYNSQTGKDAALWLKEQIETIIGSSPSKNFATVELFEHKFLQPSVIARIEGTDDAKHQVIILTAHLDSINTWVPWFGRAPGADDNGSGTVTILDAFRVLVNSGFKPNKTIEFHWYAGEEGGLLGSQDVAKHYKLNKVNMLGQLHFDMTGFFKQNEVFGIVMDNVNHDLVDFLRLLITTYSRLQPGYLKCGYACSDHASWNKFGYRSVMAYESQSLTENPNIHTPRDTVETLSFDHIIEFSKVAVAYCLEYGM
ncbi:hypothetical protein BB561_005600 [Smittium simulii]|uniref:Peptide hydrolase n=1 Tax=Smittium simulii TaxID=133385 RepID=A0A2T9Y9L6_9FUNG|nr:hypothetical protein BB561_005600 [Smittium simulii]